MVHKRSEITNVSGNKFGEQNSSVLSKTKKNGEAWTGPACIF
jgi:hypothetical protein